MIARLSLALAMLLLASIESRADAPAWLRTLSAVPAGGAGAAVVLLDQEDVTVGVDGRVRSIRRYAVRIANRDGRDAALAREVYVTSSGRIRAVRGWIISAGGRERDLGDRHVIDVSSADNDVYNEVRVRAIAARDEVAPGDVFGAEIESEDRMLFAQFEWVLQNRWPTRQARRSLTLPPRWTTRDITFNAPSISPRVEGLTTIWEARDLPGLSEEPLMPPATAVVPRVAVSVHGEGTTQPAGAFASWKEVAGWLHGLSASVATPTESVAQRARELTSGLSSTGDRIGAIGRFTQKVQYVSIQTGLGRGGGYQPRAPEMVLARNYGDCKDKAALMRSLLAAVGIPAYLVTVYSGDPEYVRREWPSPQQFNHAIVAVSVDATATGPAILKHPALGPLLLFDPTDPYTPVGELPIYEQGSLALIVSPLTSDLDVVPLSALEEPLAERTVEGSVDQGGKLLARITERTRGEAASSERAAAASLSPADYHAFVSARVSASVPGGKVLKLTSDPASGSRFELTLDVEGTSAQASGNLLLVKAPFTRMVRELPSASGRTLPVSIERARSVDTVSLEIPQGFAVDELPQQVSIETPFGRYGLTYRVAEGRLVAQRTLDLTRSTVPASNVGALRAFLEAVRAADDAVVVLQRK